MNVGNFLPSRTVGNANTATNGELYLWKWLIDQKLIKTHVFCVGSAWDWDMIKYFPNNGTILHLFEPIPNEINMMRHYAETSEKYLFHKLVGNDEPVSKIVQANIRYNSCALGAEIGRHNFWESVQSLYPQSQDPNHPSYQVEMKTLDVYCKENDINHIDFLKIDTEGWELDILKGGKNILNNCDFIQFEYGGTYQRKGIKLQEIYEFLNGWKIYNIEQGRLNLHPTVIEDYAYSNYLASKILKEK
jgi:FkbM family methyltransferase